MLSRSSVAGFVLGFSTCASLILGYWLFTTGTASIEDDASDASGQEMRDEPPAPVEEEASAPPTVEQRIAELNQSLQQQPDNADGWLALYRLYRELDDQAGALDALSNYSHYQLDQTRVAAELETYKRQLQTAAEALLQAAKETDPAVIDEQIRQMEAFLSLMPVDAELHWLLARLYRAIGDPYQADYHELLASGDPHFQQRAASDLTLSRNTTLPQTALSPQELSPQNLSRQKTASTESRPPIDAPLVIPLRRHGAHFLVNVVISGNPAQLLLDTGASLSGVTRTFADRHAGLVRGSRTVVLGTAGGTAQGQLFSNTSLELGDLVFRQHDMVVFPVTDDNPFDGVLGVDILGKFDFYIDQNQPALHLRYAYNR